MCVCVLSFERNRPLEVVQKRALNTPQTIAVGIAFNMRFLDQLAVECARAPIPTLYSRKVILLSRAQCVSLSLFLKKWYTPKKTPRGENVICLHLTTANILPEASESLSHCFREEKQAPQFSSCSLSYQSICKFADAQKYKRDTLLLLLDEINLKFKILFISPIHSA